MQIKSVKIDGFRNIDNNEINFNDEFTTLISLNSYGKSNLLNAIKFAVTFIKANRDEKIRLMASSEFIPLNKKLANKNFVADFYVCMDLKGIPSEINYGFEFSWIKNNKRKDHGCRIEKEWLTVRVNDKHQKPAKFIFRDNENILYKSSETGRCATAIDINSNELVINKLLSFDGLFYKDIILELNNISMYVERDFDPSEKYYSKPIILKDKLFFDFPNLNDIPRIIYMLKDMYHDYFELLQDAFKNLFPNIINIDVKEINLGNIHKFESSIDAPYIISNKVYSLFVQDTNLNQPLDFSSMSDGAKRVFLMLTYSVIANIKGYHIIAFEEPENSIHPNLLQGYLTVLNELAGSCKIILSSHSPYIVQYVSTNNIYIGKPNYHGVADFSKIDNKRVKALLKDASESNGSVGNYIFELLSGSEDDTDILLTYLEKKDGQK